jgi:glycosyltransferase involved in cell wall biosynthesis
LAVSCDQPLVSVIVPCYNQARYLAQAVESVMHQTLDQWEVIIVNDGSNDNTREVATAFAQADPRVHYVEQGNRGVSAARNRGLDLAKGRYIQFLDSDDFIAPTKLEVQVGLLRRDATAEPSVAYCDYFFCDASDSSKLITHGQVSEPRFILRRPLCDLATRWETDLSIPIHCFLFDIRLFRDRGIRFDETLPNHEDWDCWLQLFAIDPPLLHSAARLATYRKQGRSMSSDRSLMWKGMEMVCEKQQKAFSHDAEIHALLAAKREDMRRVYQKSKAEQVWQHFPEAFRKCFERHVPWPLQRAVFRLLGR